MELEKDLFASSEFAISEEELFVLDTQSKQQEEEIIEAEEEIKDMMHSCELFSAISDTITKCGGVTKSLEVMFGENFNSTTSMEAEAKDKKAGILVRVWEGIKKLFHKLIDFFKTLFKRETYIFTELKYMARKAKKIDVSIKGLRYVVIKGLDKDEDNTQEYVDTVEELANALDGALDKEDSKVQELIKKLNTTSVALVAEEDEQDGSWLADKINEAISYKDTIGTLKDKLIATEKKIEGMINTNIKKTVVANDNGQGIDIGAAFSNDNLKTAITEGCRALRIQRSRLDRYVKTVYAVYKVDLGKLENASRLNKTKSNESLEESITTEEYSEEGFWKDLFQGYDLITLIMRSHHRNFKTAESNLKKALSSDISNDELNSMRMSGKIIKYDDACKVLKKLNTLLNGFKSIINNASKFDREKFAEAISKNGADAKNIKGLDTSKWSWKTYLINVLVGRFGGQIASSAGVVAGLIQTICYMTIGSKVASNAKGKLSYTNMGYTAENAKSLMKATLDLIKNIYTIKDVNFKKLIKDAQAGNKEAKENATFIADGVKQFIEMAEEFVMYVSMMSVRIA